MLEKASNPFVFALLPPMEASEELCAFGSELPIRFRSL